MINFDILQKFVDAKSAGKNKVVVTEAVEKEIVAVLDLLDDLSSLKGVLKDKLIEIGFESGDLLELQRKSGSTSVDMAKANELYIVDKVKFDSTFSIEKVKVRTGIVADPGLLVKNPGTISLCRKKGAK